MEVLYAELQRSIIVEGNYCCAFSIYRTMIGICTYLYATYAMDTLKSLFPSVLFAVADQPYPMI